MTGYQSPPPLPAEKLYVCNKCGFPAPLPDLHHEPSDIEAGIWACDDAAACGDRAGSGLWWTPLDRNRQPSRARAILNDAALDDRRAHALHAAVAHHRNGAGAASHEQVAETYRFFLGLLAGEE